MKPAEHSWEDGCASLLTRLSLSFCCSFIRLWHLHLNSQRWRLYSGRKWSRFKLGVRFYMLWFTQGGFNGTTCVLCGGKRALSVGLSPIYHIYFIIFIFFIQSTLCVMVLSGPLGKTFYLADKLDICGGYRACLIFIYGAWAQTIHHLPVFITTYWCSTRTVFNL